MYTHLWKWWTIRDKLSIIHNLGWKVEINGKLMGRQSRRPPPRAGGEGAKRGRVLRRIGSDVGNCKVSACSMMFKLLISMFYLGAAWCAYSLLPHVLQVSGHACLYQVVWTVIFGFCWSRGCIFCWWICVVDFDCSIGMLWGCWWLIFCRLSYACGRRNQQYATGGILHTFEQYPL